VVGAKTSLVGWKSQGQADRQADSWRASGDFEESEGGNHFMFMENPEKFNRLAVNFIK
jgi:pimeloyl-ACP methyl ester carboxylesterase